MDTVSGCGADVLDAQARALAQAYLDGSITEREARGGLAELVFRTRVAQEIIRTRWCQTESQRDDLEEMLIEALTLKTLAPPESGGLDIRRIADGASLTGWARNLGRLIAASKYRDLRAAATRATPFSMVSTADDPTPFEHPSLASPPADTSYRHAWDESVLVGLEEAEVSARSEAGRVRARARALRAAFELPPTVADPDLLARYHVRAVLCADPHAALASLRERGTRDAHPLLSPMWSLYDEEAVETVDELTSRYGPEVATLLLQEQVAAEAYPPMPATRALKSCLTGWSTQSGWRLSVGRLADAFLAVACAPLCAGDRRSGSERLDQRLAERHQTALSWHSTVNDHLSRFPFSPLGGCTDAIASTLFLLLDEVLEDPRRGIASSLACPDRQRAERRELMAEPA